MYSGREGDVQKKPSILTISESLDLYVIFSFVTFLACPKKGDPIPATCDPGQSPGIGQSREVDL